MRTLKLIDQPLDIVELDAGLESQVQRLDLEQPAATGRTLLSLKSDSQGFVHDRFERSTRAARLIAQTVGDILLKSQSGAMSVALWAGGAETYLN